MATPLPDVPAVTDLGAPTTPTPGLTLRRRPDSKYQNPSQQVGIRRADRVRIVKMDPEKQWGSE